MIRYQGVTPKYIAAKKFGVLISDIDQMSLKIDGHFEIYATVIIRLIITARILSEIE